MLDQKQRQQKQLPFSLKLKITKQLNSRSERKSRVTFEISDGKKWTYFNFLLFWKELFHRERVGKLSEFFY